MRHTTRKTLFGPIILSLSKGMGGAQGLVCGMFAARQLPHSVEINNHTVRPRAPGQPLPSDVASEARVIIPRVWQTRQTQTCIAATKLWRTGLLRSTPVPKKLAPHYHFTTRPLEIGACLRFFVRRAALSSFSGSLPFSRRNIFIRGTGDLSGVGGFCQG